MFATRKFGLLGVALGFVALLTMSACSKQETQPPALAAASDTTLVVHKSPTCGCCGDWVTHVEEFGFDTKVIDINDLTAIKAEHGLTRELQSCHTAIISGYVFEGHVPAPTMKRFLANPPAGTKGLAVPGMPVGSPGMEMEDRFEPYEVLLLHRDGSVSVFEQVKTAAQQYVTAPL